MSDPNGLGPCICGCRGVSHRAYAPHACSTKGCYCPAYRDGADRFEHWLKTGEDALPVVPPAEQLDLFATTGPGDRMPTRTEWAGGASTPRPVATPTEPRHA